MKRKTVMKYDISVGDKFYCNNYSTRKGHALPDYLIVTKVIRDIADRIVWIEAKYENHSCYTKERMLSSTILDDSNLNPLTVNPQWVFLKAL